MATIFLDLDGTLTDSKQGITRCFQHAMAELGLPVPAADSLNWVIGPPLIEAFARLGAPDPDAAIAVFRQRFATVGLFENRVYDGIPEALAALVALGHTLCLATSKPEVFARRITARFGLDTVLRHQVGASLDASRTSKRDVLAHAVSLSGAAPDRAVMVGDRHHDIDAARDLGLASVGVLWGYGARKELSAAARLCTDPGALVAEIGAALAGA